MDDFRTKCHEQAGFAGQREFAFFREGVVEQPVEAERTAGDDPAFGVGDSPFRNTMVEIRRPMTTASFSACAGMLSACGRKKSPGR